MQSIRFDIFRAMWSESTVLVYISRSMNCVDFLMYTPVYFDVTSVHNSRGISIMLCFDTIVRTFVE